MACAALLRIPLALNNLLAGRFAYWVITTAWGLQEDPGRERAGEGRRRKVRNAAVRRPGTGYSYELFRLTHSDLDGLPTATAGRALGRARPAWKALPQSRLIV